MKISHHAIKRGQQRGISQECIDFIRLHGTPIRRPGDVLEYRILKKDKQKIIRELKHEINIVESALNKAVLVSGDKRTVITSYHIK